MVAIYRGPLRGYSLDSDDVLWLARALGGEAEQNRATAAWHAWSWMDRFHLWRYSADNFTHFWELIRAHSVAVNPAWMTLDEEFCVKKEDGTYPKNCSQSKLEYRAYWCSRTQEQLEQMGLWQLAVAFQNGDLPRPVREPIPDFAAEGAIRGQGRPCNGYCVSAKKGGGSQCFLPLSCLEPAERATILPGGAVTLGTSITEIILTSGGILLLATFGYGIYRLIRR